MRPYIKLATITVVFALSAGCALGPDYQRPEVITPDQWQLSSDAQIITDAADDAQWWRTFNDEALNTIIERARNQNLTLQVVGLRVLEARAILGIAQGLKYPQLQQLNGSVVGVEISENAANISLADQDYADATLSLNIAWEADFWGRYSRGIQSADAALAADMANYADALVLFTAETAQTYILIRLLEERLALAIANEIVQTRALEIATVNFDNGATTELDVSEASTIVGDTRSTIPVFQAEYRKALNALAVLLGETPGAVDALVNQQQSGIPQAPSTVTVGIPAELIRRRPDVIVAERQLAAQSARIGVATTDLYPRFSLAGSVGFQSSDSDITALGGSSLGDLLDGKSSTGFLGPFVSWNILNYARIKNNIRIQDVRFQQLLLNYQNTVLRALAESDNAIAGYLAAQQQAQFLEFSATASLRSVELSLLQYQEGTTDFNRVLAALQGAVVQQDLLALSRGSIASNLVLLYRALGGGWQNYTDDYVSDDIKDDMLNRTKYWRGVLD